MYEADEESWKLTSVVNMTGRELLEDLEISRNDIIQTDAFENVEPEEDDVQYTGNEGATSNSLVQKHGKYSNKKIVCFYTD